MSAIGRIRAKISPVNPNIGLSGKLGNFYFRGKQNLFLLAVPLVCFFSLPQMLPALFLLTALSYIRNRAREDGLLAEHSQIREIKPFYNVRRFARIGGPLLALSALLWSVKYDEPSVGSELTITPIYHKGTGRVKRLELDIPIDDPLFESKITFRVTSSMDGRRVTLPFDKIRPHTISVQPKGQDMRVGIFSGAETLGDYSISGR